MKIESGIKAALPIVLGYIPVGIAFGLISKTDELPLYFTIMLSSIVFAGASQFMAAKATAMGVHYMQIIIATFFMNCRHFIMSTSIAARLDRKSKKYSFLVAFFVTDESFAVTGNEEHLNHQYLLGVQITAYLTWNIATIFGYFFGSIMPVLIQKSMGITLYVLFVALLIPELKKSKPAIVVSLSAACIHTLLLKLTSIDSGWALVFTMLLASFIGFILFKDSNEDIQISSFDIGGENE